MRNYEGAVNCGMQKLFHIYYLASITLNTDINPMYFKQYKKNLLHPKCNWNCKFKTNIFKI